MWVCGGGGGGGVLVDLVGLPIVMALVFAL